jgi:DNA-binding MarR family transcriptional regulator
MPDPPRSLDPVQLGAYFALIEVVGLLRHAVEQQLREAGDLSYVQFQLLARLGDSPTGSHRMTDLADGVVYSRSGLTYQAGLLEKRGLVTRATSPDDERGVTVTITDAGRALLGKVMPGHAEVIDHLPFERLPHETPRLLPTSWRRCATTCARPRRAQPCLAAAGPRLRSYVPGVAGGSLSGRPVALTSSGEVLSLSFMHAGQKILAVRRWIEPGVADILGVTHGVHVRPILVDPGVYLMSSADGPVAGDEDIDVAGHALEQPQRGEVVLDRVRGVVQVEQRNQDVRKHVAGEENPAFLDQQRRVARGVRLVLDDPDSRAIPRNLRHVGGEAGDEAEQVQRYLLGDVRRYHRGDAGLRTRV